MDRRTDGSHTGSLPEMRFGVSRAPSRSAEAFLLAAIWFGPLAFGAVEPWSLCVLESLLFVSWSLAVLHRPAAAAGARAPLVAAALALAALGLLQCLNPRPIVWPASLLPFTAAAFRTGPTVLQWCAYAALLWSAPRSLGDRPAARRLAWSVFLLGAVVAVIGIMQGGQGNGAYYGLRPAHDRQPFGPYPNADHAASLLVMSLCMGFGIMLAQLALWEREKGQGRRTDKVAILALVLFLSVVIAYGLWQTQSRGGLNSLAAAVFLAGLLAAGRLRRPVARRVAREFILCGAAGYGVFLLYHPRLVGLAFGAPDSSTAYRLSMYRSSLRLLGDFPVFGIGLGTARTVFPAYQEGVVNGLVEHLHCDWIELAATAGIVGACIYLGAFIVFLWRTTRRWLDGPSREMSALAFGALAALLAFAAHGLTDFSFQIPANAVVFLALAMLFESSVQLARIPGSQVLASGSHHHPSRTSRILAVLVSSVLCALTLRPAVAAWYKTRADALPAEARAPLLAQALAWSCDPEFEYGIAWAYFAQAKQPRGAPEQRTALLRLAQEHAQNARDAEPHNAAFQRLCETLAKPSGAAPG